MCAERTTTKKANLRVANRFMSHILLNLLLKVKGRALSNCTKAATSRAHSKKRVTFTYGYIPKASPK